MAVEFLLPDIGEGIADAEIVEWHVAPGETVAVDDPLVDVQTDKALVSIASPFAGTVASVGAAEGDSLAIGAVLVTFEAVDGATSAPADDAEPAAPAASSGSRPLASPAVRRLARERGVDLSSMTGSGPRARVLASDVTGAGPAQADGAQPPGAEVVPLRGLRRAVAESMSEAWRTIPHITDLREVDVTRLLAARRSLKAQAERDGDEELARALTVFALLAKITATVVRAHPALNATVDLERREMTLHGVVDLNVAVSTPEGLVAPAIRQADRLPLPALARELLRLGDAARNGRLTPSDLAGGTVTASNYGSLGSPSGTTIVQTGQSAVVGFGRAVDKPVARDGAVVVRPIMQVHCSGDHRAMDGRELQAFTDRLAATIDDPVLLLAEPG